MSSGQFERSEDPAKCSAFVAGLQSAVSSRQSAVSSGQSAVGSQQWAVGNLQWAVGSSVVSAPLNDRDYYTEHRFLFDFTFEDDPP